MKPLILDFIQKRKESEISVKYKYSYHQKLNVTTVNHEEKPLVDIDIQDTELLTKTRVHRENDDEHFHHELGTKTEAKRERDDYRDMFLEFSTKTFTRRERED
jgi:hypothetical protein